MVQGPEKKIDVGTSRNRGKNHGSERLKFEEEELKAVHAFDG